MSEDQSLNNQQAYAKKYTEIAKKRELNDMTVELDKRMRKKFELSNKIQDNFVE